MLFFFLVMSIVPVKQRFVWVVVNIIVAILLITYQYHYPEAVPVKHRDSLARSVDFAYVYFFTLLIVYFIITSIINSYNREKTLAENRAELLELSNQSKNKLFSILAHDLRSPLNSIQNFLEMSLEEHITETEKKVIHSSLLRETRYTRQMLINLLSWSKTQMDGVTVNLTTLDLQKTLESTILLQASLAEEKGILINNLIQEDKQVIADHDMLELVIRNLINNAIKFTSFGGEINISSEDHGSECWICVQDNGVGITKTNEQNIFSLQSESTYGTNNEKGVGLGLVLCKEFILLQRGKIWVESEPGVGTTFFISLKLG
jgi:two-component system sensor histidine kinase/response regulator